MHFKKHRAQSASIHDPSCFKLKQYKDFEVVSWSAARTSMNLLPTLSELQGIYRRLPVASLLPTPSEFDLHFAVDGKCSHALVHHVGLLHRDLFHIFSVGFILPGDSQLVINFHHTWTGITRMRSSNEDPVQKMMSRVQIDSNVTQRLRTCVL